MSEFLKQLEKRISEIVPPEALVTKVGLQTSEVVIYTKNMNLFLESEGLVKTLAGELKKRVHIRSDSSMLTDPETAKKSIEELIPENAGINDISFDPEANEVVIEARKPGVVIGKHGQTLKAITLMTGWYPRILRVPTMPSPVMKGIRYTLLKESKERAKIQKEIGTRIYREQTKKTDWVRLTPLGGAREVGRSCFLLETPESKVMIDCGVNVASNQTPYPLLDSLTFPLDELDAVIISHAHLDHSGFLPYLYKYGFNGPTYCTAPTRDIMTLLALDYVDVAMKEGKKPPYGQKDIKNMVKYVITREYGEVTDISPDMRLTLHNAGHILGSSSAHLHIGQGAHNLLYTADFKFGYTKLFDMVHTRYPRIETLIMESTYGGPQDIQPPRYVADKRLITTIKETARRGGSVLIPAFAVGRSQEIMLVIEEYAKHQGWDIPVYIDGMIREVSAIHTAYPEFLRRNVKKRVLHNSSPLDSDIFIEVDKTKRREIFEEKGSVFIAPSGMLTGGPSVEYFKNLCEDPRNSMVFIGYQGEGSLGKKIQNLGLRHEKGKTLPMHMDGRTVGLTVNMHIETIEGYSGHSDRNQLLGFYKKLAPKPDRAILVHGDEKSCLNLGRALSYQFKVETNVPRNLDSIRLR
ncbi:MAG: beta-CASP ribonuclease aCPSF1 [Candidatus Diapherotrites archaeon]|nr:beta-CASP ribonuclease aCPSF1 [Candidatus Diapherotrites archaeon]